MGEVRLERYVCRNEKELNAMENCTPLADASKGRARLNSMAITLSKKHEVLYKCAQYTFVEGLR